MKKLLIVLFIYLSFSLSAQKNYNMQGMELILEPLMEEMFYTKTSSERFAANEKFISELEDALAMEKSFAYPDRPRVFPAVSAFSLKMLPADPAGQFSGE